MSLNDPETASEFYERLGRFSGLSQPEQILRAAWFQHNIKAKPRFQPKDITAFFAELNLAPPNVHPNIKKLCERRPKALLWDKNGYYLEGSLHRKLSDSIAPKHESTTTYQTAQALRGLSDDVKDPLQRTFLAETFNCYRVGAFRATIVMAWNLAYDHLLRWLLVDPVRINNFNLSLSQKYPKKSVIVKDRDSFADIKEFEVVETAQHAKLISKNVADILKEKLKRRNAAAHPSDLLITQAQADDVITDLVHNVVRKLD